MCLNWLHKRSSPIQQEQEEQRRPYYVWDLGKSQQSLSVGETSAFVQSAAAGSWWCIQLGLPGLGGFFYSIFSFLFFFFFLVNNKRHWLRSVAHPSWSFFFIFIQCYMATITSSLLMIPLLIFQTLRFISISSNH